MSSRAWAIVAHVCMFVLAMIACAISDWHAPHGGLIAALFVFAIGAGVVIARRRFFERASSIELGVRRIARVADAVTFTLATLASVLFGAACTALVVWWMADWTQLVLGSTVGAACISALVALPTAAFAILRKRIDVGCDAIEIGRLSVPLVEVQSAEARDRSLVVRIRNGRTLRVTLGDADVARTFAALLTERTTPVDIPPMLAQRGRKLAKWRDDLLSPKYRSSALTADEAERVLCAGNAKPDERIGAAIVLASLGQRARIGELGHSFASPSLRVALRRAADDTLDDSWIELTEQRR